MIYRKVNSYILRVCKILSVLEVLEVCLSLKSSKSQRSWTSRKPRMSWECWQSRQFRSVAVLKILKVLSCRLEVSKILKVSSSRSLRTIELPRNWDSNVHRHPRELAGFIIYNSCNPIRCNTGFTDIYSTPCCILLRKFNMFIQILVIPYITFAYLHHSSETFTK